MPQKLDKSNYSPYWSTRDYMGGKHRLGPHASASLVNHLYRVLEWWLSVCPFVMMIIFYPRHSANLDHNRSAVKSGRARIYLFLPVLPVATYSLWKILTAQKDRTPREIHRLVTRLFHCFISSNHLSVALMRAIKRPCVWGNNTIVSSSQCLCTSLGVLFFPLLQSLISMKQLAQASVLAILYY